MAKDVKSGRLLYHVTALQNMESILRNGLLSRIDAKGRRVLQKDVADSKIIQKRKDLKILNYVPFHFFEPTAFTGTVFKSNSDTTFCTITIRRAFAKKNGFQICTAHPLSKNPKAEVFGYDEGFDTIDWTSLEKRDYNDGKSKNAGMAECLAISPVSPEHFHTIYVPTERIKQELENMACRILGTYSFFIDIGEWCTQEGKI